MTRSFLAALAGVAMHCHMGDKMRKIPIGVGIAWAAMAFVPLAGADPTAGHDAKVRIQTPPMLCEIGSDDADPGIGPNVVCQGAFPQSPMDPIPSPGWKGDPATLHQDQAVVTASGHFSTATQTSVWATSTRLSTPSCPARPTTYRAGR